jgi:hypothetical protein
VEHDSSALTEGMPLMSEQPQDTPIADAPGTGPGDDYADADFTPDPELSPATPGADACDYEPEA